jgi:protein-S-isoprenylcysteine O-methyltransferase Ste14
VKDRLFFFRGYLQDLFVVLLLAYVWFFPEHSLRGTRLDILADIVGICSLAAGALLRVWAVSHPGRHTRSRTIKAPSLVTTGPYACVRNPIYLANFLIGLGLVVLAEAIVWVPFYFILFGLPYRSLVDQEERFLRSKFGEEFGRYCEPVPRWLPRLKYLLRHLHWGQIFISRNLARPSASWSELFSLSGSNHLHTAFGLLLFMSGWLTCIAEIEPVACPE